MQNNIQLEKEWFSDSRSLNAFAHAIELAQKAQAKLDKSKKGAMVMFDDELLVNPSFEVKLDGINSSVHISMNENNTRYSYSLCGCTSDADTGQIWATKKDVIETFKRISFYKKY